MGVFKNREDYLKGLCEAHPIVAHGHVVDGELRNSFFRLNDEEEISTATFRNISYPNVGYLAIDGRITDKDNAMVDIRHVFKNQWIFLTHLDRITMDGDGYTDRIETAFDITFMIMEDFIKAIKEEYETNGMCGEFQYLDLNQINYVQVGPMFQSEYGWILYFTDEIRATNIFG